MADGWAKKIAASLLLPAMAFISAYLFTSAFSQSIRQKLRLGLHFNGAPPAPPAPPASQASPEPVSTTSKDTATSSSLDLTSTTQSPPGFPSSTKQGTEPAASDGRSFSSSTSGTLSTSLRQSAWPEVPSSTTHAVHTTQAAQGSPGSEPSLQKEQAPLGPQWRPLAASDRYRFTPQTLPPFRQCEEEHLGMSRWKQKLRGHGLDICGAGVSTITCARHLTKQQVYVCQFRDVLELLSPSGTLSWVAQCNLRRDVDRRMLFSQLSPRHPLQNLDVRRELGAKQLSKPITIIESLPGNVSLLDHVSASLQWSVQNRSAAREGLTFMSTGDCNTGNPGHCQADQDNLFIVQHILPKTFSREETRVVLYNGFGRSRYSAQKTSLPHFYEDWQALSAEIVTASYSAGFPSLKVKAKPYVQLVRYLVSGPAGMTGPHWTRFNQPGLCEGRSPLLLAHQMAALPFFESEWGRVPKRYGDACNFMQRLSAEYSLNLFNGKACKIDARQSNFYLWISRIPPDCHKIPSLDDSCGKNRGVANGLELASELSKRYADTTILYVNTGTIPYLDQVFLIRAASTIIAAHGGGLWNAARWLNEALHQRIVEIMPIGGPSESCSLTKMFGCRYNFVTCYDCITPRNGRLPFEKLLKAVEATEGVHCNGV